jgi:phosphoesterase RecJ-like protein
MKYRAVPGELIEFISSKDHFLLLSHIDPDGDCIASSLALGKFLTRISKTVEYYNPGPFGRKEILEFEPLFSPRIPESATRRSGAVGAVVLDCSTKDRIGALYDDLGDTPVAVIDHHSSGKQFGDIRFINSTAPSTSLLVQQLIEEMGYQVSLEESEYIFFAFTTDTGFFRHLGEQSQVSFQMIAKLVEAGASPRKVYQQISHGVSLESRKHLGLMLQRVEPHLDGKMLYTWETFDDIRKFGRPNRDSDTLYQQLLNVENTEIILVLREESPGSTTGSIRTSLTIDAGKLAEEFGGGGHARAAGFTIEKNLEETFAQLKSRISELL